ncbi:MAG: HAMP domain-containing sensor histidine kinase [bacterium]
MGDDLNRLPSPVYHLPSNSMFKKLKIAPKLNILVGLALTVVIGSLGYINIKLEKDHAIDLTIRNSQQTAEVILKNLDRFMQNREIAGIQGTINTLVGGQTSIEKLRLLNHEGDIVASSQKQEIGARLDKKAHMCMQCHPGGKQSLMDPTRKCCKLLTSEAGQPIIVIVTPIPNRKSCYSAPCHFHPEKQKVLGMIQTNFSLVEINRNISRRAMQTAATVVIAIIIISIVIGFFIRANVSRPAERLLTGMKNVAGGDFEYRHETTSEDEIGHLARGFNTMTAEIDRLQKKLIQSERLAAIGEAIASILHGAKNVLNALKGGSYMIKTGLAKNELELVREGWTVAQTGVDRIADLTSDMLNFTRELEYSPVLSSINEIVSEICDALAQQAKDVGVTLTAKFGEDVPLIRLDRNSIHTAILNLVSNAIDACGEKEYDPDMQPFVRVTTSRDADNTHLCVEVEDNGVGISDHRRQKIFAPFFTTKFGTGTGLGLPIALKIVTEHGGTISVDSSPGEGSKFTVTLPVI